MKNKISLLAIAVLLLSPFSFLLSQNFYFDNYNVRHGLAQSNVYAIVQDNDGYVWLGTGTGLSRFDGRTFINFSQSDGLAPNGIRSILQTPDGMLWMGHTGGGLSRFDGKKFEEIPADSISNKKDITYIAAGEDNSLWLATQGSGAILLKNINGPVNEIAAEHFSGKQGLSDLVFSGTRMNDGRLILVTDFGLKEFIPSKNLFEPYVIKGMPTYFQITCIHQDARNDIWMGTYNGGLYRIKADGSSFVYDVRDGLGGQFISYITSDREGTVWVGHWVGGITRFRNEKMLVFNADNGLPDQKIRTFFEDREGNLLIGTNETGLLIFKGEQFRTFSTENILVNNQVWSILQDSKNRYWIGTNGGIHLYDPSQPSGKQVSLYNKENQLGISSDQVRFLKEDSRGTIWAGFWDEGGVREYNDKSKKFQYNILVNNFIRRARFNITAMDISKDNTLWVGTTDGLVFYEIVQDRIDMLTNISGLAGNDISAIYCDSKNRVWIGSRGAGLTLIEGSKITPLNLGVVFTPTCITEDKNGNILFGTESHGVVFLNDKRLSKMVSTEMGLMSNMVTALTITDEGILLIGTNRGLNKYNIQSGELLAYTQKVGFSGIEVKSNASFLDRQGNVWFGTVNGLIKFALSEERVNRLEPLTHITRFMVNLNERAMAEGIKLHHSEKSIYFEFNSICLTDPDAVFFQYMLKGADNDWRPLTNQQFANYSPLPPGKYTFLVKARNNTGVWNENPVEFSFEIRPPFWQTWWFYMIIAIISIISLVSYIKIRERALREEKRILEEKVKERTIEISEKNIELARKNKDITDSINYARRIQSAIMPPVADFNKLLPNSFIFYRPKDIVSGDFYWFTSKKGKTIVVAADCTGHGVPGAFMSMIGVSFLSEIVNEKGITEPDKILNQLRDSIITVLQQTENEDDPKDGMDLALICIDNNSGEISYAGAYNSLYQVRRDIVAAIGETPASPHGEHLLEFKADRMPIGISDKRSKPFSKLSLIAAPNDMLYIFTDGYMDQFGGPNGKKFLSRNFKDLLAEISSLPSDRQIVELGNRFDTWKANYDQIDDILVIGIKI